MTRYESLFADLKEKKRAAFVPFVILGDPTPEISLQIIKTLIDSGADALELGIPFSDPIADGPTIQAAAQRALAAGTTPDVCWSLLSEIRQYAAQVPIGLLTYANLAAGTGLDHFYGRAGKAGVDSVLMADVPTLEVAPYAKAAAGAGVDPIMIAPPNADSRQLDLIAQFGRGYTYVVTRFGVTGARRSLNLVHDDLLRELKARNAAPSLMGFGISTPDAVRQAIKAGADGAISGSAIVSMIENWQGKDTLAKINGFVQSMSAATQH